MVPKLHKKGRSFRGAAQYLLHDKGADTSERVAWHETRNLATDNPHLAWRIMAATAMDQARLKQEAGVKNTGRKSDLHVQHMTLSWHEDEADSLDRDAMLAAADSALVSLDAQDRQAMIVCHDDEPHPHVHILLNRVSPDDGRILSSSKEKLKLSEWAEAYEKERGRIWCDERVINNAARRRGEYTRGVPSKARHLYEADQHQPSNDNASKRARDEQKRKDAELSRLTRQTNDRQAQAWMKLEKQHKQRVQNIKRGTKQSIQQGLNKVREDFRPRWTELHHEQQVSMRAFEQREETIIGRIQNRFKSLDLSGLIRGRTKPQTISETFGVLTSKAARQEAEKKQQQAAEQRLRQQQQMAEQEDRRKHRTAEQRRMADTRNRYAAERMQLSLSQQAERAKLRAQWNKRNQERSKAHARLTAIRDQNKLLRQEVRRAPQASPIAKEQNNTPPPTTQPSNLLPKDNAEQRAQQIEDFKKKMQQRSLDRKQERDHGDRDR